MMRATLSLALAASVLASCARINEEPVLANGDRVRPVSGAEVTDRSGTTGAQATMQQERDENTAAALASCVPDVCAAIARGELALGMSVGQVLAATGTGRDAWVIRTAGDATVMTPSATSYATSDNVGQLAMVQLDGRGVRAYSYREASGVRLVDAPEDATVDGRARARADALVAEGDELVAAGDLERALARYDQADILTPDPGIQYRIATVLDKQLRPYEALIRYQLFLHQLDLERIDAEGRAAAHFAEAIAHAQQRVIVLERQGR
jgi:tetratricopeptide (TPR) repeat protein